MNVTGNLYTPNNMEQKYPAIIVGHPMGAVKEQSANLYATKMACDPVHRAVILGRERGPAAQCGIARHLRRRLQRGR